MTSTESVRRPGSMAWMAVLCVAACIAFSPAIRAPFIFDDLTSIPPNASIRTLDPSIALRPPKLVTVSGRPIVNYSLAVDYAINRVLGVDQGRTGASRNATVVYHATNILLHLLTGCLVFGVLRRTLRSQSYSAAWSEGADSRALIVTGIWMLHPLQSEAVDYTIQRTELLASLFYLATLYASIRSWDAPTTRRRTEWWLAGSVACLAGMASKEIMITAPVVVILYDRAFRSSSWRDLFRDGRSRFYSSLAATSTLCLALVAASSRAETAGFNSGMPWYTYLYSQGWAIWHYLRLLVWPAGLSIDYGSTAVAGWAPVAGLTVLSILVVLTVAAWRCVVAWGWAAFIGSWFFLLLAPSSSVVPIATEIAAERRVYLALLAPIIIIVIAADSFLRRVPRDGEPSARRSSFVCVGAAGLLLVLGTVTATRSQLYSDPERLWRDAIAKVPLNARAYGALGSVIVRGDSGRAAEAESLYRRSVEVDSQFAPAWYELGLESQRRGRYDDADRLLSKAVALRPDYVAAVSALVRLRVAIANERASVLLQTGQAREASAQLEGIVTAGAATGFTWALVSESKAELGDRDGAIVAADRALASSDGDPRTQLLVGSALFRLGESNRADSVLERLVVTYPSSPDILTAAAQVAAGGGRRAEARRLLEEAIRVDPAYAPAREALQRLSPKG